MLAGIDLGGTQVRVALARSDGNRKVVSDRLNCRASACIVAASRAAPL